MDPITIGTLIVLGVGAALSTSGCDDSERPATPKDTSATDASLKPDIVTTADAFIPQIDSSENVKKPAPAAPKATLFANMPCAFPSSLSYSDGGNFYSACGGEKSALYRKTAKATEWEVLGEISGYPSHHIPLDKEKYLVTKSGPDGFAIVDSKIKSTLDEVSFGEKNILGAKGEPLSFVPNTPAGAVFLGSAICIASSNLDSVDMDATKTTYFPGTIICFPYSTAGKAGHAGTAYFTSGLNSTGMVALNEQNGGGNQRFAVLSSNDYNPDKGSATLDIFKFPDMAKTTIDLGGITGQIAANIARSGNLVYIGVQKPVAGLLGVNVDTNQIDFKTELPDVKNFVSSIQVKGSLLAVSDFGVFGEGGRIIFMDNGWNKHSIGELDGAAGPSTISGYNLYQVVTSKAGDSSSIFELNLTGLE